MPSADAPPVLSGAQIRERFLRFFEARGHKITPSASLVPTNDTVLLTPAGMLPFVPVFLGIEPPPTPPRAVSSQKCARVSGKASDLENVGRTPRHHTFFEMLGNFSFGDYFKADAIAWAWAFITEELKIPTKHLWVSVLKTDTLFDEEAFSIWRDQVGVPEERILFCDEKDNFWGPPGPTGPCGPCSEIHYDREPEGPSPKADIKLLETDRFVEIWNLVFMELFQDSEGKRTPLEKKNIDTGMGLERIAMVVQGKQSNFETDLLTPIVAAVAKCAGVSVGQSADIDVALRIVADHARFIAFAMADSIVPSNEGRGYVLRMILRRAVRYGKKYLGLGEPFLGSIVQVVEQEYGHHYGELPKALEKTLRLTEAEEVQFFKTLERGSALLDDLLDATKKRGESRIDGEEAFRLYDTYGFPLELTNDIAQENGMTVDLEGFERAMAAQRERARSARSGEAIVEDQVYSQILDEVGPTRFLGYETLSAEAKVVALIENGQRVQQVSGTNQPFEVILEATPFYAESGGQVGDRGTFSKEEGHHGLTVVVNDTKKVGDLFVHKCLFDNGDTIAVGEILTAQVEPDYRQLSAIHHSATHLLNAALLRVLGDEVTQAGSYVSPEGARFDFTFSRGLTASEVQRVEYLINKWVMENTPRLVESMDVEQAKQSGAIAMFGEKYGDTVRVVSYGERSRELCGGTHVERLGEIGLVKVVSESSIASGVRRIEMVAGERAYKHFKLVETDLSKVADLLKTPVKEVAQKVERLLEEMKQQERLIKQLAQQQALLQVEGLMALVEGKPPVLIAEVPNQGGDALKAIVEALAKRLPEHVVVLGSAVEGKAVFVASVSQSFVSQGVKAGDLVKTAASLCGGGGGGKPTFAQAGGKDGEKVPAAIQQLKAQCERTMSALQIG